MWNTVSTTVVAGGVPYAVETLGDPIEGPITTTLT